MDKGIIAAPAKVIGNGASFKCERLLSSQELKYFLLYWDKVVIPTTNLVHLGLPEEDEFISTGVVSRPVVPFSGSFNGEVMANAQLEAQTSIAKQLIEQDKSTDWVVHQIGDDIILPTSEIIKQQTIKVDIINALPAPDESVSIQDIMEFKEMRSDELEQLHCTLDDFYLEILASPDQSLSTKRTMSDLTKSISNIQKTTSEKWGRTTKFDFSAQLNLNVKDFLGAVAAGAIFDHFINISVPFGAMLSGVASLVKIEGKISKTFEPSKNKQILSYLSYAHKENILK